MFGFYKFLSTFIFGLILSNTFYLQSVSVENYVQSYFSLDQDIGEDLNDVIISYINATEFQMQIASYYLTSKKVAAAIAKAYDRGVHIDILIDQESESYPTIDLFKYLGINIWVYVTDDYRLMHNKFMIFDRKVVLSGSHNPTASAAGHIENIIAVESRMFAYSFYENFFEIVKSNLSKFRASKLKLYPTYYSGINDANYRDIFADRVVFQDKKVESFFSHTNNLNSLLVKAIDNATTSVRIAAFYLTSTVVVKALINAFTRGCLVEIIVDNSCRESKQIKNLINSNIPVWIFYTHPAKKMHNKYLIIDKREVLTGSHNPTQSASKHRENIIKILDQEIAYNYEIDFEAIKKESQTIFYNPIFDVDLIDSDKENQSPSNTNNKSLPKVKRLKK